MGQPCSASFSIAVTGSTVDATIKWRDVQQTQETRRNADYVWNFIYTSGDPRATDIQGVWSADPATEPLPTIQAITHQGFHGGAADQEKKGRVYFRTPEPSQDTVYQLRLWLFQA